MGLFDRLFQPLKYKPVESPDLEFKVIHHADGTFTARRKLTKAERKFHKAHPYGIVITHKACKGAKGK